MKIATLKEKIKKIFLFIFRLRKKISAAATVSPHSKKTKSVFTKTKKNPILKPNPDNLWESCAVFNTAVLYLKNKIHFLYRAIGESGMSVLGYAASRDGIHIDQRSRDPAYICKVRAPQEQPQALFSHPYMSGGSWSGCEDPRLTQLDNRIYMTYTAFDGCHPPGVALTSISVDDFLNQRWRWNKTTLISSPGEMHKNWVIFPEKINGHYAILHSITPHVMIDYFETLDFDGAQPIRSHYHSISCDDRWDNWIRGVGAPPLKTPDGWLVLYHAMDKYDPNRYKIGALILDKKNPGKILYRSNRPLLEPDEHYENEGFKTGVVYTCGALIIGEKIWVYYGGADTVICAASANLRDLLVFIKGGKDETCKYPLHKG